MLARKKRFAQVDRARREEASALGNEREDYLAPGLCGKITLFSHHPTHIRILSIDVNVDSQGSFREEGDSVLSRSR